MFRLRLAEGSRIDADFVLTLRMPEGVEHWDFGWNLQDGDVGRTTGDSSRERFDFFMRSLFEDHSERGRTDRSPDFTRSGEEELLPSLDGPGADARRLRLIELNVS